MIQWIDHVCTTFVIEGFVELLFKAAGLTVPTGTVDVF